jgi:Phage P22-like portal protein
MAEDAADPRATDAAPGSDEAILQEILDDYDYDVANLTKIRAEAAIDVAYASNDTWTVDDEKVRAGRPMLNLDQLSQYRNQIENTVRQNKRGVKVSPAGNGATDATAELRANRIREIEYQSHAQEAYSQMFSDCLTRGYGFGRIVAEYEDEASDNQVFRAKAIANPNQVIPDTDGQSTSGRDWKRCVFIDSLSHAQFKRDYPDAAIRDFENPDTQLAAGKWLTATRVQIAEAWRVTETPNPRGTGKPHREVCMYLTNGLELLAKHGAPKKHPWKGKYIPFISCLGRIIYKDTGAGGSEKLILSYARFARDGAKGYNWAKSTILEKLALPVKASLIGYKGQADADTIKDITRATQEHVPWLEFAPTMDATGTAVLPLPQYGTREPDIQADMIVAEGFARDIQNALGHFNASDGRLGQTKVVSGIALQEQKRAGDLGSYDFQDHYDDALKFFGEQYDDLLDHYDDAAKEIATRLPDLSVKMVTVNTPTGRAQDGSPTYDPKDARFGVGRHTVTISTGPSSDSQREAGKEAALTLLNNPQAFPIVASDAVKLMDLGPIGDQMAEDLEFLQPPAMQQARQQKDGGAPDPRQLQQHLEQLKQQLQHAEGVMQQMDGELKGKQAEIASKEKIAQLEIASKERIAAADRAADRETKLAVAYELAKTKDKAFFYEERARIGAHLQDTAAQAASELHEHQQAELARVAAVEQAQAAQQHQVGLAAAGAGAAADAQAAGHAQTLEVGQQAADLAAAPEPAAD